MNTQVIPNKNGAYVIAKLDSFYDSSQFKLLEILKVEMLSKKDAIRKAAFLRKRGDLESRLGRVRTKEEATELVLSEDWLSMASCNTSPSITRRIKELEGMLGKLEETQRFYFALPEGIQMFAVVSYDQRKERQKASNEYLRRIYLKNKQREDANPVGPMELDYEEIENPILYQIGEIIPIKKSEGMEITFVDSLKDARNFCALYSKTPLLSNLARLR